MGGRDVCPLPGVLERVLVNRVVTTSRGSFVVEEVELVLHAVVAPGAACTKLNSLPSEDSIAPTREGIALRLITYDF